MFTQTVTVMISSLLLSLYFLSVPRGASIEALICYSGYNREARQQVCDSQTDHCTITGNSKLLKSSHLIEGCTDINGETVKNCGLGLYSKDGCFQEDLIKTCVCHNEGY